MPSFFVLAVAIELTTLEVKPAKAISPSPQTPTSQHILSDSVPTSRLPESFAIAQLFYPPVESKSAIRVIGRGTATVPADAAELSFEFNGADSDNSTVVPTVLRFRAQTLPFSESSLQSILKALNGIGVPSAQIRVSTRNSESDDRSANPLPFPLPLPGKSATAAATIVVRQDQPTQDRLTKIAKTVQTAVGAQKGIQLTRVGARYTLKDCRRLETVVYQSAVQDARGRAQAIASAMGATPSSTASITQPLYDLVFPACGSEPVLPFEATFPTYEPNTPPQVSLSREIFATYTLQP
ncbi:MAG TPA: SIMPL domain-containing protein [Stenomitos sp.]